MSQTTIDFSQDYATWVAGDGADLNEFTIDVTGEGDPDPWTWANLVNSYIYAAYPFHRGSALSVWCRASNSSGPLTNVSAASDGGVFRRSGSALSFGTLEAASFTTGPGIVTPSMLDNGSAISVLGRSANSAGARADITASTQGHVLHRTATPTLAFGTLLAGAFATAPGIVTPAMLDNGSARSVLGRSANSSGARADIAGSGTASLPQVLSDDGTTVAFRAFGAVADEVMFDIDCTAQATNDWNAGGDGNYSLGGFTWAIANTGVADTLGPVLSTGLRFNASANSTDYTTSARTATYLRCPLTTLVPTWDVSATYIFEIHLSAATLGVSANRVQICVDWDNAGTDRMLAGGRRNSSGTQQTFAFIDNVAAVGAAATHTAIAIKVNAFGVLAMSGTYSGGFPTYQFCGASSTTGATSGNAMDGTGFFTIAFPTGEAGGAMDCTIARIRCRRIRG